MTAKLITRAQNIIGTNLLTKKNAPPPGSHVFQPTGIIFQLFQDIIGMNLLTKFHEDRTINVVSRENCPAGLGSHVFQANIIIFKFIQDIIETNLLTKFHEDQTVNEASRVLTRFYYSHIRKIALPLGSHVFQANIIIFKLIQDIIETNLLTKFHEDWTINVASRVLTRNKGQNSCSARPPARIRQSNNQFFPSENLVKNAPPPGGHVFQAKVTIFELIQDIIGTNLLTKFYDNQKINVTSRKMPGPHGGHVFQPTSIIFELVQVIIGMNLLTEFHEDRTINVASRVKNAPPLGSHVFQSNLTIFELIQNINKTNLLTKFHEDRKINVASRVLTRKNDPSSKL
ncbi:hypothetical protein DPMN_014734 [Dreissena polymorpha]|uniref:Uncharacterized protein n=1 Tax=Dreissena polymorpha TaxID=45954 RepID=A0A9D4NBD1_DREPO|nr:hypothetical protein DPMN_014734 [Dreissena polymorpha]